MAVLGAFWLAKLYPSTLISVFLNGFSYFSYQEATQLSSRGRVDPVSDPIRPETFREYSRESNPGPLEWQSDVLMVNDIWGWMGPKVSWYLSYSWGKPRKNLNQENWPVRGSNPGPLGEGQRRHPSTKAVGKTSICWICCWVLRYFLTF